MGTGLMVRCAQCRGKGSYVLFRGRGREVIACSCLAATTDPAWEALKKKLLAAFHEACVQSKK